MAPALRASASGRIWAETGSAAAIRSLASPFDGRQLLGRHGRHVGEVEPQPVVVHLRALLLGVRAQVLLQGVVQDVRRRVGAADALPALRDRRGPSTVAPVRSSPRDQMAVVQDQVAVLLRVGDLEVEARADDLAGVAHLPAALAVERRAIQDHGHRAGRGPLPSTWSHSWSWATMNLTSASASVVS